LAGADALIGGRSPELFFEVLSPVLRGQIGPLFGLFKNPFQGFRQLRNPYVFLNQIPDLFLFIIPEQGPNFP